MAPKWIPIKIWADISRLKDMRYQQGGDFAYEVLTTRLIPDILNYLKFIYRVHEVPYLKLKQKECFEIKDISNINYRDIYAHLTLVFTFTADPTDGTLAWAEVCSFSPLTGRPIAGQVNLNFKYFKDMSDEKYISHFETILHEVHHVLAINPTIFPFFRIPNTNNLVRPLHQTRKKIYNRTTRKSYTKIILPGLIDLAKKYFKC
jgi:hypothetical protein